LVICFFSSAVFIADSTRVFHVPPYLAASVAFAISLLNHLICEALSASFVIFTTISSHVLEVVHGLFTFSLFTFSMIFLEVSFGWFTLIFLAHVAFQDGAGKRATGLTNDLSLIVLTLSETLGLAYFFCRLVLSIFSVVGSIILGFVCFENSFIAHCFTHGISNAFLPANKARFVGFPHDKATQSERDTRLFAHDLSRRFSKLSAKDFHA
jgi:hypothetical protein